MTFKQCVLFCLQAPIAAWSHSGSGRYHLSKLYYHFWQFLCVLVNVAIGVLIAASTPVLALLIYAVRWATRKKRAAAQAARDNARFEDL